MRVALIGHGDRVAGVGEASRRLGVSLVSFGFDVEIFSAPFSSSKSEGTARSRSDFRQKDFDLVVLTVNPDLLIPTLVTYGLAFTETIPKVGFWSWEFEDVPRTWGMAARMLDAIWTTSEFSRMAISRLISRVPTLVAPLTLPEYETKPEKFSFEKVGLQNDKFTVLCSFDFFSGVERKNPEGAILAYLMAFGKDSNESQLVVKSINGGLYSDEVEKLKSLAPGDYSIAFIDGYMSRDDYRGLLDSCDAFLSLHRCEGYGLNILDALASGTPVISTAYSGNLEFQANDSQGLVEHSLIGAKILYSMYLLETRWAEPNLLDASRKLRDLKEVKDSRNFAQKDKRSEDFRLDFQAASLEKKLAIRDAVESLVSKDWTSISTPSKVGSLIRRFLLISALGCMQGVALAVYRTRRIIRPGKKNPS